MLSCAGARAASQPALLAIASDRADDLDGGGERKLTAVPGANVDPAFAA